MCWGGVFIGTLTVDDGLFTVDVVLCLQCLLFTTYSKCVGNIAGLAPSVLGFDKDTGYHGMPEWLEAAMSEFKKNTNQTR